MKYSIIVPVYNRPDEVEELLQSLTEQELKDFEVVIVEDGSQNLARMFATSSQTSLTCIITPRKTEAQDKPATTEPSAPMANGLLSWIPMWYCPKAI